MKRAARPVFVTNRCVTVNVDTAKSSGWCITAPDKVVVDSGVIGIMNHAELVRIIKRARNVAFQCGLPKLAVVLVLEEPWQGNPKAGSKHAGRSQHFVVRGLGGARQAWLSAWCEAFDTKGPHRVVSVKPQQWRLEVLSVTGGPGLPKAEMDAAKRFRGVAHQPRDIHPDEAAAICIGRFSQHSGAVAALLSKQKSKARGTEVPV